MGVTPSIKVEFSEAIQKTFSANERSLLAMMVHSEFKNTIALHTISMLAQGKHHELTREEFSSLAAGVEEFFGWQLPGIKVHLAFR